jgi:hypothetical protein
MRIDNFALTLDGTDMTSNINSNPIWLGHVVNYCIQIVFTGSTPNGSFKLQASNDLGAKENDVKNASITNWTDISGSTINISAAGDVMYNLENVGYRWVRVVWTDTSSTAGTITVARGNTKGF